MFVLVLLAAGSVVAQNAKYLQYIEQWKQTAIDQQKDYGIPASITMAQGLLESGAGSSELAVNANNHFGIKCAEDWLGDVYRYDDDAKAECFRVYTDASESYRDHSLFLQRTRYKTLYEIPISDYAGWAHRLKECGYATDPMYAHKLIKIIEDYGLAQLGQDTTAVVAQGAPKAVMVVATAPIATFSADPEPEYREPLTAAQEKELLFLTHATHKQNGSKYIVAVEGDSYANIAFRMDIPERRLREWNDALGRDLKVGDRVYISAKSAYGPKDKVAIWVSPGESAWQVAQKEGVQLNKMLDINGLSKEVRTFRTRQQILLRPVK